MGLAHEKLAYSPVGRIFVTKKSQPADAMRSILDSWRIRSGALAATDGRWHDPKYGIVFQRGQGATLWDVLGRDYIDLTCGYSTANFGHCFPPLVQALSHHSGVIGHLTGELHPAKIELAEQLLASTVYANSNMPDLPEQHSLAAQIGNRVGAQTGRVIFNVSGSRAIETAWQAALAHRPGRILCLGPGFHGRSMATSPLSNLESPEEAVPVVNRAAFINWSSSEYPYCERCPVQLTYPACDTQCGQPLLEFLQREAPSISAVLVEPALGARGYIVPPNEFFIRIRRVTNEHNVLMIADEIQTGLGRCGAMQLSAAQGWTPDLVVIGKSLGGGLLPISACVGRADVLDCLPPMAVSETFAATPLACAVALEVLKQLRESDWIEMGSQIGEKLRQSAANCLGSFCTIGGIGASCTIEFSGLDGRMEESQNLAQTFASACCRHGVLVHLSGPWRTRVVLLPPFVINQSELATAIERLGRAASEIIQCSRPE